MSVRNERLQEELRHTAATFFSEEAGKQALITVTSVDLSKDGQQATILFTVFPEEHEQAALFFAQRKERVFRAYAGKHIRVHRIPAITFTLDAGEKNRQRIDELLREG